MDEDIDKILEELGLGSGEGLLASSEEDEDDWEDLDDDDWDDDDDDMTVEDMLDDVTEEDSPDFGDGPECDGYEERAGIRDDNGLDFGINTNKY